MASKKPKRTAEEYLALIQSYFDDWAVFLGVLPQWDIDIKLKPAKDMEDTASCAEVNWPTNYTTARISFKKEWLLKSQPTDEEIEEIVVHELGHIVGHEAWDFICDNFAGALRSQLIGSEEKTVDKWAHLIRMARGTEETDDSESL